MSCQRGKQWDITATNDPTAGWVVCNYNYDFSTYAYENPSNNIYMFAQWLNDVFSSASPAAPSGMDQNAKYRIRDANVVYAIIYDFYNQIFNTGYYGTSSKGTNPFNNFDFLTAGFQPFISNYINSVQGYFYEVYNGEIPDDLLNTILGILSPPRPIQNTTNPDLYYISVYLSWTQFQEFTNSANQANYISNCIGFMLRDSQGEFQNTQNGGQWSTSGPFFVNPTVIYYNAVQLVDKNGQQNYEVINNIVPSEWTTENYGNCMFGNVEILAQVSTWSPMLVAYFTSLNSSVTFSENICKIISSQCGEGCVEKSTIPSSCFPLLCTDAKSCRETMANYCSLVYDPPNGILASETDNLLVTNNNSNCMCYTSTLPPAIDYSPGNPAAMCFDTNCNPTIRADFGLNNGTCSSYCDTVWEWMNSTNPATQSQNQEYMDWVRFKEICGENFKPYTSETYNKSVLFSGILVTLLLILLIFSICKHSAISTTKTWIILITAFIVFLGLTIFLCKDLAGTSSCNGKNFVCTSKITKKNIPAEFCSFILNCECESDQDCPGNCVCASTTCKPQTGPRPTQTISKRQANIPVAVCAISLGIIIPIALIYLYEDYHWKISKTKFVVIAILLGLILIGIGVYALLRKTTQQIFSGACCSPQCENKECGEDGCGGVCGTCASGVCLNGKCSRVIDGCPFPGSTLSAPVSLPSGNYSIQYINKGIVLVVNMRSGYPVELASTSVILPVAYDAENSTLIYGDDAMLVAKDLCLNTVCGNDKNIACTQQSGLPSGVLYCLDAKIVDDSIPHRFILSQQGIYSVEANAYIIPDTRAYITGNKCPNCPQGNNGYLTYTTDPAQANVWTITQLN